MAVIQLNYEQGKSHLVYSNAVSLNDTVTAATKLTKWLLEAKAIVDIYRQLHPADGVLHNVLETLPKFDRYPAPHSVSENASEAFITPPLMFDMKWLVDKEAYDSGDSDYQVKRTLTLTECVVFCSQKVITPFLFWASRPDAPWV